MNLEDTKVPTAAWHRDVDRKIAEWELLSSASAHRKAGVKLDEFIKKAERFWNNELDVQGKLMKENV